MAKMVRAGFAIEDISPPLGTPLLGTGVATKRPCTSVNDPTYARAVAIEDAGQRALIVGLDLCFLGRRQSDQIKAALQRELGLRAEQVLLNCSHTHAAAAASEYLDMSRAPEPLAKYMAQLVPEVVRVARSAGDSQ